VTTETQFGSDPHRRSDHHPASVFLAWHDFSPRPLRTARGIDDDGGNAHHRQYRKRYGAMPVDYCRRRHSLALLILRGDALVERRIIKKANGQ